MEERTILWERGDYCLRTSLYCTGLAWQFGNTLNIEDHMKEMKKECRLNKWLGHRKSNAYRWSDDIHRGKLTIRSFLWKYFLRFLNINPYCGLNGDQYRAYFVWLSFCDDFLGALKVEVGFIIRSLFMGYFGSLLLWPFAHRGIISGVLPYVLVYILSYIIGIYPSMTDFTIHKPQARVLQWKVMARYIPIYWIPFIIGYLVFCWRSKVQLEDTINEKGKFKLGTTNKITMLPTRFLLGMSMPNKDYIDKVYNTYWKPGTEGYFIGKSIREGLYNMEVLRLKYYEKKDLL